MIERYSREQMRLLWSDQHRFEAWLEVELLTIEAWSQLGHIPVTDAQIIRNQATFSVDRIQEIEQETKHDVIAFTRAVSESLGAEKKWVHYGLTSTDVVDTAYGYVLKQVNDLLAEGLYKFRDVLKQQALKYKDTIMMGRTHGIHAEPTTFGLKFALWYQEFERNIQRFELAREHIEVGKISGAVGTFANTPLEVEEYVCKKLGIDYALVSTQTLQRDRHAFYIATLALIATSLDKIAIEIRHLQRSEVQEVQEYFSKGQKGSSAMPHKKNPISSENISGCARVLRGYVTTAYENVGLWHERDISHSSAERIILPDATMLLDYMLDRFTKIIGTLLVYPEQMLANMQKTYGLIFSQQVMLALIQKGWSREESYDIVQPLAMRAWEMRCSFQELLLAEARISAVMSTDEIVACFDPKYHLKNVDAVYQRMGF